MQALIGRTLIGEALCTMRSALSAQGDAAASMPLQLLRPPSCQQGLSPHNNCVIVTTHTAHPSQGSSRAPGMSPAAG